MDSGGMVEYDKILDKIDFEGVECRKSVADLLSGCWRDEDLNYMALFYAILWQTNSVVALRVFKLGEFGRTGKPRGVRL